MEGEKNPSKPKKNPSDSKDNPDNELASDSKKEDDRDNEEVEFVQGPSLEEEMAMEEESEDDDKEGVICSIDGCHGSTLTGVHEF